MRRLLLGLAIASIAALSPCWVHADDQQIATANRPAAATTESRWQTYRIRNRSGSRKRHCLAQRSRDDRRATAIGGGHRPPRGRRGASASMISKLKESSPDRCRLRLALPAESCEERKRQKPGQMLTNLKGNVQRAFRPERTDARRSTAS